MLEFLVTREAADQIRDERHVGKYARPDLQRHFGRSRRRKTNRIAPWVSEKLTILLSTRPAARPASIRSVSRRAARGPLARTTQMAPLGSIQLLMSVKR